jgi:hypothetical protein
MDKNQIRSANKFNRSGDNTSWMCPTCSHNIVGVYSNLCTDVTFPKFEVVSEQACNSPHNTRAALASHGRLKEYSSHSQSSIRFPTQRRFG